MSCDKPCTADIGFLTQMESDESKPSAGTAVGDDASTRVYSKEFILHLRNSPFSQILPTGLDSTLLSLINVKKAAAPPAGQTREPIKTVGLFTKCVLAA